MGDTGRLGRSFSAFLAISALLILAQSSGALGAGYHKVSKGDTLWRIARAHGVSVRSLAQANGLRETSTLPIGKTLVIPGTGSAAKPSAVGGSETKSLNVQAEVRCDNVCLRSGPSTRHSKVAVLKAGTPVTIVGQYGSWRKVVVKGGAKGFIARSLLDVGGSVIRCAQGLSESDSTLIRTALACRGMRYRRGGTSRGGFDCSGFTRYVYAKYGVSLPHSSAAQSRLGTPVTRSQLQPGDLVFFETYRRGISHVGIYIGNNQFVHASTPRGGVRVDSLNQAYYSKRYRGARRVN